MKLQGQHALVTGGGRGIGAAISSALVKAGVKITITGRSRESLEQHTSSLQEIGEAQFQVCDVTDPSSISSAFANAANELGPITVLINNAGQAQSQPFLKTSLGLWQQMLEVNLTGTFLCTQAALPGMLEMGWGRIINVSSTAGLIGHPYVSAYSAAKHGVIGLTRSLALELAKKNITVNAVCPGYTETEIVREAVQNIVAKTGRSELEARAELTKNNPQARMIQPNEIADTVLWLCNPSSSSITGQAIAIAGGEVMT
jgi:NAD(P)-dependent dehydrogenase (short-subunit alcohol dehydrogenase family)